MIFHSSPLLLFAPEEKYQAQHQAVQIIHTLSEYDDLCLTQQADVVLALRTIWTNDLYKVREYIFQLCVCLINISFYAYFSHVKLISPLISGIW